MTNEPPGPGRDGGWRRVTRSPPSSPGARRAADAKAVAIERAWDATPPNVLHATLFALRQVGKAYIYATDGPGDLRLLGPHQGGLRPDPHGAPALLRRAAPRRASR